MVLKALNDIWIAIRAFDEQAMTFASIAVLIYIFFIIIKYIYRKLRHKKCDSIWQMVISICLFGILCIYLSYLISLTLSGREAGSRSNKINLELFGTFSTDGSISKNAAENVLLFIPFGILVPLMGHFFKRWWNLTLLAFISSMLIELTQLITARGYFEVDDIVLNTLGALLGYMAFSVCYHSYIDIKKKTEIPLNKHEIQINRVTLFVIQLLPVILVTMMIFRFSGDNAEESSALSLFVTEKLLIVKNKILGTGLTAEKIYNLAVKREGTVRTLAHMIEYALLTVVTFVFIYCRRISNYLSYIITFVFVIVIACCDEVHQINSPGRSASIADVGVDSLAAIIVLAFILLLSAFLRYYRVRSKVKNLKKELLDIKNMKN